MKKWPELERFLEKSESINVQKEKLEEKKKSYQNKIIETEREINQMIIDEATLGKSLDEAAIDRLENRIDRHKRKISRLDQRINSITDHKTDALKEYIPDLYMGYKKQMEELRFELEELEKDIIPKAAEYLSFLNKIGKRKVMMKEIDETFKKTVKGFEQYFKKDYHYPTIGKADTNNPYDFNTTGVKLFGSSEPYSNNVRRGITSADQLSAVNTGGYPPHIALYLITGEQEMNESRAVDKLKSFNENAKLTQEQQTEIGEIQKELNTLEKQRNEAMHELNHQKTHELSLRIAELKDKRRKIKGGVTK